MKTLETETVAVRQSEPVLDEEACRKQALRLLAFRDRSENEMVEALQKRGYQDIDIAMVLSYLKEKRYIDDENYSRSWAAYKMENTPVGPFRLKADLRKKGFGDSLIRSVSEAVWLNYSEFDVALKLARRRYVKGEGLLSTADLRRISGFLQRRGFSGEVVGRVLSQLGL